MDMRDEIGRCIADPMWADHAEVSKAGLKRWHDALHHALVSLECAANWIEKGCDPQAAAAEIRLVVEVLKHGSQ